YQHLPSSQTPYHDRVAAVLRRVTGSRFAYHSAIASCVQCGLPSALAIQVAIPGSIQTLSECRICASAVGLAETIHARLPDLTTSVVATSRSLAARAFIAPG